MNFIESLKGYLNYLKLKKTNNKLSVYFYSESLNYRNYYLNVIHELNKKKNIKIFYFTSDRNDLNLIDGIKPIFIGDGLIRMIFFTQLDTEMMVMTLTDLDNHQIKRSKKCKNYAYIFHSLVSTHKGYNKKSFNNYDIIFANGKYQKKELEKAENLYHLKKKKIFVTGYPYFEYLKNKKHNIMLGNKILFAPSWTKKGGGLLEEYSIKIIKKIIQENEIIFRPHPQSLAKSKKIINSINKQFKENKNYVFNKNIFDTKSLFNSALLITDNGGMALEYSLIFKKPVIYIDFKEKVHNEEYKELDLEPIEDSFKKKFGNIIKIDQLDNLNIIIKDIIKKNEKFHYEQQNFINNNQIIFDKSSSNIAEIINKYLK